MLISKPNPPAIYSVVIMVALEFMIGHLYDWVFLLTFFPIVGFYNFNNKLQITSYYFMIFYDSLIIFWKIQYNLIFINLFDK